MVISRDFLVLFFLFAFPPGLQIHGSVGLARAAGGEGDTTIEFTVAPRAWRGLRSSSTCGLHGTQAEAHTDDSGRGNEGVLCKCDLGFAGKRCAACDRDRGYEAGTSGGCVRNRLPATGPLVASATASIQDTGTLRQAQIPSSRCRADSCGCKKTATSSGFRHWGSCTSLGKCDDTSGKVECDCGQRYRGSSCDECALGFNDYPECVAKQECHGCENGAPCNFATGRCECPPMFSGIPSSRAGRVGLGGVRWSLAVCAEPLIYAPCKAWRDSIHM